MEDRAAAQAQYSLTGEWLLPSTVGYPLGCVQRRRVRDYARGAGLRNETDEMDAGVIADYTRAHRERLPLWQPLAPQVRQLQELVRRRHQLEGLLLAERNRLEGT